MQEPKLTEEELIGLSEEEKQQKIAELEQRKKEYWEERYRRNVYEFPDVAEWDKKIKARLAEIKKAQEQGK